MKMMKTLILAAAALLGACAEAATPETATGSSAYFHVCTSNDTVKIIDVWSKYCDGEYAKGQGRNATFLKGISIEVDFTIYTENQDEEDPIDHCEIVSTGERIEMYDPELAQFRTNVGLSCEIGEKLEIKAVTRDGAESKPFRVNFDVAKVPDDVFTSALRAVEADDSILYQDPDMDAFSFFKGLDGVFKLARLVDAAPWTSDYGAVITGAGFSWVPEIKMASVMDSSTGKVMTGALTSLGNKTKWTLFGDNKLRDVNVKGLTIGKMAGADVRLKLEGDVIAKWNPEKKTWVNIDSVIGANVVVDGQWTFRIPQTLYICYVSVGVFGDEHFLIRKQDERFDFHLLGQPLVEGVVEGGGGIDGCRIAVGGEVGVVADAELGKWNDFGFGGQFFWAVELFNLKYGDKGLRKDDVTSIDDVSYRWMHWVVKNGAKVDSVEGGETATSAALQQIGPTKANAAKLAAVRPAALAASPASYVCNPQPALATRGGVDALLYLTNAAARATSDQSKLVFRKGADGAWGAVETPWDDGTADLSPAVGVAGDGTVVAAWVNLKGQIGNSTQLTDITRKMEIAVGVRNPSTGVWTSKNLTADDQVDFAPRVAVAADGTAYVAWCANPDNAFYGSNTVVKCVKFAGGAWGNVVSLGKVGSVNGLAVAARGANGAIACTVEDGGVYKLRGFEVAGGGVVGSTTVVGESWIENPDVGYDAEGGARFHWVQDGALWTKRGFAAGGEAVVEGTADAVLPHDAAYLKGGDGVQGLVWQHAPKTDGTQNGVMLMACDATGKWQVPATLWLPAERASAFAGAYAADGTLRLAYESVSGSRDMQGVMRSGAAALKNFELAGGADVSVTANEIGVEGERVFYGGENEFVATIHNLGRTNAVNVPVKFIAVANGVTNEFFNATTNVVAGGSVCLASQWNAVEGYTNLVFKVLLDPKETVADGNRANNVAEWSPKAGTLAIVDERYVREAKMIRQVNAKVVTDGALVIPEGTVVEYRRGGVEGELLATDTLGEIVPGEGYGTGFRWDMAATTVTSAWETVYLKIRGYDHAVAAVDVMTTLDTDGDGVVDGEEGLLGSDPTKPDAPGGDEPDGACTVKFAGGAQRVAVEGTKLAVRVKGGNAGLASSVQVVVTYNTATAADLDLKGALVDGVAVKSFKFPVTLNWAKGEIGEKTIVIPVAVDKAVEADEMLTLQLANPMNLEIAGEGGALGDRALPGGLCTVTIRDPGYGEIKAKVANGTATKAEADALAKAEKVFAGKAYVRGLANDATRGKVAGSALAAAGKAVTLKATANKGFVFAGWYEAGGDGALGDRALPASGGGALGDRALPVSRETSLKVVSSNEVTYVARFITPEEDSLQLGADFLPAAFVVGEAVQIEVPVESVSLPTVTVSGLPAGLKFAAKDVVDAKTHEVTVRANTIYGAPTKATAKPAVVTVTAKNLGGYVVARTFEVTVGPDAQERDPPARVVSEASPYGAVAVDVADDFSGTVSGAGVYPAGKTVTLKAAAAKGYVFSGWYAGDDAALGARGASALPEGAVSQAASFAFVMPSKDVSYVAKFVTAEEDAASVAMGVNGIALDPAAVWTTNVMAGVYLAWPVAADALSQTTVAVAGLPAGLKFTAKDIVDSKTRAVTVPANTIYGAPTTASKVDKSGEAVPSVVKVTVTTAGKAKSAYALALTVDPLPAWAVGTFDGGMLEEVDSPFPKPMCMDIVGAASFTVASSGKVSGKAIDESNTWALSAPSFTAYDAANGRLIAEVAGKSGANVFTSELFFAEGALGGVATNRTFEAYQSNWKAEPWKTLGKGLANKVLDLGDGVTLKFAASGAVSVSAVFGSYKGSASTVLVPTAEPDGEGAFDGIVCIYLKPDQKKGFAGYGRVIRVRWDGVNVAISH